MKVTELRKHPVFLTRRVVKDEICITSRSLRLQ